jgi:hypothetical protein
MDTLPPRVSEPACEKVLTALASLRMKTKSVSSKPIWPPKPAPPVAMAVGALHEPSGRRAITRPLPKRAEPRKPAFMTVRIARPYRRGDVVRFGVVGGRGGKARGVVAYLGIGED